MPGFNDTFSTDAFNMLSMTAAINKLPHKPTRIRELKLFSDKPVNTRGVVIDEKGGVLSLVPSVPRGQAATQAKRQSRTARTLNTVHIPIEDTILASDLAGVRKFGSEDELEGINEVVAERLQTLRDSLDVTLEWLMCKALHGIVVDGDASTTIYNLFTEFNVSAPAEVDFLLGTDTTDVGDLLLGVKETIETNLGAGTYDHIHCLCHPVWFRKFVSHPEVKYAFQYYQEGQALRDDTRKGFEYKGVIFESYRATVGTTPFITSGKCRFFPVGVPDLFLTAYSPGEFIEAVNTLGLPMYAKQEELSMGRGIKVLAETNPLPFCTRPNTLVGGTSSN